MGVKLGLKTRIKMAVERFAVVVILDLVPQQLQGMGLDDPKGPSWLLFTMFTYKAVTILRRKCTYWQRVLSKLLIQCS